MRLPELVLWLVDPNYRICSTRNVPPQRSDWWAEARDVDEKAGGAASGAQTHLMDLDEAKALRLELMDERTSMSRVVQKDFDTYNLCEH